MQRERPVAGERKVTVSGPLRPLSHRALWKRTDDAGAVPLRPQRIAECRSAVSRLALYSLSQSNTRERIPPRVLTGRTSSAGACDGLELAAPEFRVE